MPKTTCDKKPPKPHRGPQAADSAERAEEAFGLSLRGLPLRAIAETLGVSPAVAHKRIKSGRQQLSESIQHDAKERLAERHGAIAAIRDEAWANYRATADLTALELVRKCESDLRKLFGDDAPARQRTELTGRVEGGVALLSREEMYAEVQKSIQRIEAKAE